MYYDKDELEEIRRKGEELLGEQEIKELGYKYISEAGIQITCLHCKYERFECSKALLNTRGMTFFDLDWLNAGATTLICKRCGFIHWFVMDVALFEMNNNKL